MADNRLKRMDKFAGFRRTPFIFGPFGPLWEHFPLVRMLVWTEVKASYARSTLGLFWLILYPLFYVMVFVAIRILLFDRSATSPDWMGSVLGINDIAMVALMIFMGFVVFWGASEVIGRSAGVIMHHATMIQGSVFPVEMLPWVVIGTSIFNMGIRAILFIAAFLIIVQSAHVTALLFPLVVAPMMLMMIGVAFLFATIGTYFRDLEYIVSAMTTGLLLLSAVLYPLSEVPESYRPFVIFNPMAMAIEQARNVVILGRMPDWSYLGIASLVGVAMSWGGFAVFRRFRSGFANVL